MFRQKRPVEDQQRRPKPGSMSARADDGPRPPSTARLSSTGRPALGMTGSQSARSFQPGKTPRSGGGGSMTARGFFSEYESMSDETAAAIMAARKKAPYQSIREKNKIPPAVKQIDEMYAEHRTLELDMDIEQTVHTHHAKLDDEFYSNVLKREKRKAQDV